jgi:hypothetical protein
MAAELDTAELSRQVAALAAQLDTLTAAAAPATNSETANPLAFSTYKAADAVSEVDGHNPEGAKSGAGADEQKTRAVIDAELQTAIQHTTQQALYRVADEPANLHQATCILALHAGTGASTGAGGTVISWCLYAHPSPQSLTGKLNPIYGR